MKKHKFFYPILFTLLALGFSACDVDVIENPNGPTLESLQDGATLADLRLLAHGLESAMRIDMEFYFWTVSIVGREYYDLNGIDPRYTGELVGEQGAVLDNNGFLTTRSFAARYKAIRNAWVLINAVENSNASLTSEQANAFIGYAKTIQAYSLLMVANRQFENGIRTAEAVRDPDNLGAFTEGYSAALSAVAALLDEASGQLSSGGAAFLFNLSSGFDGLNTPAGFNQFNRALAARVNLYLGNKAGALSAANQSFMDMGGDLNMGAYYTFGTGGNDIRNPLFNVPNSDLYTVHPSWLADAEDGDTRVAAKTTPLDGDVVDLPVSLSGLSGDTQVTLYDSDTDPVPIIRNEELILISAEANIGSNNAAAVDAINVIRTAAGLPEYSGGMDDGALLDEVLRQRRYSLYGEGHRWLDLRRTNRTGEIPKDRPGDVVHTQFPRPVTEN